MPKMTTRRGTINLNQDDFLWDVRGLDALLQQWLDQHCYLKLKRATADVYADKIQHFRNWLAQKGPAMNWEMREADFYRFREDLEETELGFNSRNDVHRRLRSALKWAFDQEKTFMGDIPFNFTAWIPPARGSAPARTAAPLSALEKMLQAAHQTESPIRNQALLVVLAGTGIRRAECSTIDVETLCFFPNSSGHFKVSAKEVENRIVHERYVAFDAETGKYIQAWLAVYKKKSGALFPSTRFGNDRLSPIGIYRVITQLAELAGVEAGLHGPHDLRRMFSTWFERKRRGEGYGRLLSKQLGHANYTQTTKYSLQDVEDIREVLISPVALINQQR
jgi:integrase